jgi:ABC-type antimicrobial peptide transport system permease subunit
LDRDPTLMLYVPFWKQAYQATQLVVRSEADPASLREEVRKTLQSIDPAIPAPKMRTMEEIVDESVAQRRFQMRVAAAFGISALLLAALGIYGVVAYGIALRRRELGIRMALGAQKSEVLAAALGRALKLLVFGSAAGLILGLLASRVLAMVVYGATPRDPLVLAGVVLAMLLVGLIATWSPAQRALAVDPAMLMRED